MKFNPCKIALLALLLLGSVSAKAQQQGGQARELVAPAVDFFVPHWYVNLQVGGAYDVGEAKFKDLISPALQATIGYEFNENIGLRGGISGLWARNRYAYPSKEYKWNFIQPAVDFRVNVSNLIMGRDIERVYDLYAFLGGGAAFSYNNDDAVDADKQFSGRFKGDYFQKLWKDTRWHPVVRGGIGADFWMNDYLAINVEANANMLPDHFNSKLGKHDNRDWHFNLLAGLRINLGPSYGLVEPQYRDIPQPVAPPEAPKRIEEEDGVALVEYVQFEINKSIIRSSEYNKILRVASYLHEHPKAHVELTGFADKLTGNATINQRLSVERAQAVSQFLVDRGITRDRISKYAKGDRVQPFQVNEDNRVTICIVIDDGLTKEVQELRESIK